MPGEKTGGFQVGFSFGTQKIPLGTECSPWKTAVRTQKRKEPSPPGLTDIRRMPHGGPSGIPDDSTHGFLQISRCSQFLWEPPVVREGDIEESFICRLEGLKYTSLTPWIKPLTAPNTLPIINKTDFSKIAILHPSKTKQQRLAPHLSSLDARISAETQKIEAIKTHKKSLMKQLFPASDSAQLHVNLTLSQIK